MRENPVKAKLRSDQPTWGTFVFEFNTTGIARIASEAGAAFALFDMGPAGWSTETSRVLWAITAPSVPVRPSTHAGQAFPYAVKYENAEMIEQAQAQEGGKEGPSGASTHNYSAA